MPQSVEVFSGCRGNAGEARSREETPRGESVYGRSRSRGREASETQEARQKEAIATWRECRLICMKWPSVAALVVMSLSSHRSIRCRRSAARLLSLVIMLSVNPRASCFRQLSRMQAMAEWVHPCCNVHPASVLRTYQVMAHGWSASRLSLCGKAHDGLREPGKAMSGGARQALGGHFGPLRPYPT